MFRDHTGIAWDLTDPATYTTSWFPKNYLDASPIELHREIERQLGYALYYMDMWVPFRHGYPWPEGDGPNGDGGQRARIMAFAKSYLEEFPNRADDATWLKGQLFRLLDEIENMC